jgi:hypothetical protein
MRLRFHSVPLLSMWLRAWARGATFPNLSVFWTKSAECFALTASFLVGYFPPKLGGLLSVRSGTLGRVTVLLYCRLMRLLKYNDRTDQELKRQILGMIELAFAQCHLIQSENREYLIFAESPLLDSLVCRGQYTSNRWRGPVKH